MKLICVGEGNFTFELSRRERQMLTALLKLYPLLNSDYHEISKSNGEKMDEGRKLLREAMEEMRIQNKKAVVDFLDERNWSSQANDVFSVALSRERMDWLLTVLNDVRVGSWVKLGKPDSQRGDEISSTIKTLPYIGAMELSGLFQSVLLQALES